MMQIMMNKWLMEYHFVRSMEELLSIYLNLKIMPCSCELRALPWCCYRVSRNTSFSYSSSYSLLLFAPVVVVFLVAAEAAGTCS